MLGKTGTEQARSREDAVLPVQEGRESGCSDGAMSQRAFKVMVVNVRILLPEMQIETTMRYHFTPVRMAVTKKKRTTKFGENVKKEEPLCTVGGNEN